MKTMHLFAGGGGGMYADLILGHTPIVAVEWEAYCCDVLRARKEDGWWPECEIIETDIRAFSGVRYAGKVDCIHAGFPCPTFSHAGQRAGLDDDRGQLYKDVIRLFHEVQPRYLFLENVPGITTAQDGYAFSRIMADLAEIGFRSIRWTCLRASDVGANHRRDRWWCLAQRDGSEGDSPYTDPYLAGFHREKFDFKRDTESRNKQECESRPMGEVLAHPPRQRPREAGGKQPGGSEERSAGGGEEVADANTARLQEQQRKNPGGEGAIPRVCGFVGESGNFPNPGCRSSEGPRCEECGGKESLGRFAQPNMGLLVDGLAGWWDIEPDVQRVATGVANRVHRLKTLGNGQVPLQAAYAWVMLGGPIDF